MADIVNLRQARKRAARGRDEAKAAENRVAFGLPKAVKTTAGIEAARAKAALDGRKLGHGGATEDVATPAEPARPIDDGR